MKQQEAIKDYLLGALSDKVHRREIEEKILLDDDFAEQLSIAEDELIEDYLEGNLDDSEEKRFTRFFLLTPERKEKFRSVRALKKYAMRSATQNAKQLSLEKPGWFDWRVLFNSPSARLAATAVLLIVVGFVVWRAVFYQSDVDKGLAQLQIAYRGQRPTESRSTANFDYAPLTVTRGNEQAVNDEKARTRAERYLLDATENSTNAKAFHALGLFYLAEKQFDKALSEFNTALKFAPNDAKLHNDIGAVYLEKAKLAKDEEKGDEVLKNAEISLTHLNRALEVDENLLEALFNKALVLQIIPLTEQAREAWEKYLEKDSNSPWADEARKQLKQLESEKSQSLSADELERAFLSAFRETNEAEAARLIGQNRELIKGKYIPQKLAMSFVEARENERGEYLRALVFSGESEEKNTGDLSAKDLAVYYSNISNSNLELLKEAQIATRNSYKLCLEGEFAQALEEATRAKQLFLQAGNNYEAKLSQFIIVYCLINTDRIKNSIPDAQEISNFCERHSYKWLHSNILYWLAAARRVNGERAEAKVNYNKCLSLAEEIGDSQTLQKILVSFSKQNNFVGQEGASLAYLQRAFADVGKTQALSLREKWRTYSDGIEVLASMKLDNLGKAVSLENNHVARNSEDSLFIINSQLDAGVMYAQTGNFDEARVLLNDVIQTAETSVKASEQKKLLARSLLTLGYIEEKLSNYSRAADFYDEALNIVADSEYPFFLYEIQKSRLMMDLYLNKESETDEQIIKVIELAEKYRKEISNERESTGFFNKHQDIYDIAVANEFRHARYERAYNYMEISNARSLLDWLKKGGTVKYNKEKIKDIEATFRENTQPLDLNEIRSRMPERVQILQYSVLENKVLIWLVSKENFTVVSSEIDFEKLNEKVAAYSQLISQQDDRKQDETKALGRELYDLLVSRIATHLDPNREICLIPQKILFHLPFAALISPDEKPFLAQFGFFYAPSANVFLVSTENARQKLSSTDESLLSIGNPRFDRNDFEDFQYLPEAEDEAREITKYYSQPPPQFLIGLTATKTTVQNSLQNAEVINFAGHYIVRHGEPLASGLLLTKPPNGIPEDGVLTNAELINQNLPRAKLVVLSACQTGVEQYYNGEGLVGLSTTFLKAGAPLVVASQWKVDSSAAAVLIKRFHFLRKQEKLSTTAALRRAQLEMMNAPDGSYRQPYFWAAFAAYGGYAEF